MCGRFTRYLTWAEIHRLYGLTLDWEKQKNTPPDYNVVPTDEVPFVTAGDNGTHKLRQVIGGWFPGGRRRSRTRRRKGCACPRSDGANMPRMTLKMRPEPDKQHVYLELQMDGKALGHMYLSAPDMEDHIRAAAKNRAQLSDTVAMDLDPGWRLETFANPVWRTAVHNEGIVLALRHPGLGWLSFLLPRAEARKLGRWLLDNHAAPGTDPPRIIRGGRRKPESRPEGKKSRPPDGIS
jgi:hypothetical protein